MDSVVIVRNHSVRSHMRYSTASYCCDPGHRVGEIGQFPLSPVSAGGRPCQYFKQTSTYQGPHTVLQPHVEEDEGEGEGGYITQSKPVQTITKL